MAKITETELQKRLRKAGSGGTNGGPTAARAGSTWEYTTPVLYLAYADSLTNLDLASNTIPNQSDATGFSVSSFNASGTLRPWRGYLFSKSMYASGDPTDYIWEDVTAVSASVSYVRYYSTDPKLQTYMGDPTTPGTGVTWIAIATGVAIPGAAFWVAEKYTFNGVTSSWVLFPVKSKEVGTPLASYIIKGREAVPALTDAQWDADTLVAVGSHTGEVYSSVKEFGYGTAVVIDYPDPTTGDSRKQYGIYHRNSSGVGEWLVPDTFVDGSLLVNGTINADKLMANSIQAVHITVTGPNAVTPATIEAATQVSMTAVEQAAIEAQKTADAAQTAEEVSTAIANDTTVIDGARITTGTVDAARISLSPYQVGAGSNTGKDRLEINSNSLKVYNAGVLRVTLGYLE